MVAPTRPANPYTGPRAGARPGRRAIPASQIYRRPGVVTVLSILNFVSAPLVLFAAAGIGYVGLTSSDVSMPGLLIGVAVLYGIFGLLALLAGIGLWNLRGYGRSIQLGFSFLGLLGFPLGTLISALILVYLFKPGAKVLFSEKPVARLSEWEIDEVSRLQQSSTGLVVALAIVLPLVLVAFVGVIAAIAIPSLLRARVSANEAAAIGDIRTVISAEQAYAASNGGLFDELECLASPSACIPGYPAEAPVFLSELYAPAKMGYHREFHPGLPGDGRESSSPSSLASYAFVAYPVTPGMTGTRGFCGDHTGRICVTMDGSRPAVSEMGCDPGCVPLQ